MTICCVASNCGITPPVFSPTSAEENMLSPERQTESDVRELRPKLIEFMAKHEREVEQLA